MKTITYGRGLLGSPVLKGSMVVAALAATFWSAGPARADEAFLLTGEGGVGLFLNKPARNLFGPGLTGAIAGYRSLSPYVLLGLRLRGAAFLDGDTPDVSRNNPGVGGISSLSLALRFRPIAAKAKNPNSRATGLWIEGVGGGGYTGSLLRPMVEGGVGYGFAAGDKGVVVGPFARYHHTFQSGSGLNGADAQAIFVGIEITLFDPKPPAPPEPPPPPPPPPAAPKDSDGDGILDVDDKCPFDPEDKDGFEDDDGCPDKDNDKDGILDVDDKCPNEPETVNGVDDEDGCPDQGLIKVVDDRVVLEERVLFETDRSRVSSSGRRILEAVVTLWKKHPEYERMEVEGHADVRGTAAYNQKLSESRAARVLETLVKLGMPKDKLSSRGFGYSRPREPGRSPEALQANRRVELVIIRKREVLPDGSAPKPTAPPAAAPAGEGSK